MVFVDMKKRGPNLEAVAYWGPHGSHVKLYVNLQVLIIESFSIAGHQRYFFRLCIENK